LFHLLLSWYMHRREEGTKISSHWFNFLTVALSKKWDNLWSAYCLRFAYYHFCRTHKTLRVTPAMEAGIAYHVWDLAELLA